MIQKNLVSDAAQEDPISQESQASLGGDCYGATVRQLTGPVLL